MYISSYSLQHDTSPPKQVASFSYCVRSAVQSSQVSGTVRTTLGFNFSACFTFGLGEAAASFRRRNKRNKSDGIKRATATWRKAGQRPVLPMAERDGSHKRPATGNAKFPQLYARTVKKVRQMRRNRVEQRLLVTS